MVEVSLITLIISLIALVYALYLSLQILKISPGSEKMQEISNAIREGAMAFLERQYKTIAVFAVIITAILWALFGIPIAAGLLYPFTGRLLSPIIAGGAMAMSSVSVVLNTLLMKRQKF